MATSLLDSAIAATDNRNGIISENHDVGSIDIARELQSATWDSYEYGMSREQAIAAIQADPKAIEDIRRRAIKRANLATVGGKIAVMAVGASWHGLGVAVDGAQTAADARRLASLEFSYDLEPVSVMLPQPDGSTQNVILDGQFAVVRVDPDGSTMPLPVGVKGPNFTPFQLDESFDFLDSVAGDIGANYHSAGAIKSGASVFMQIKLPGHIEPVRDDVSDCYLTLIDSVDGRSLRVFFTTERVVCANTARMALGKAKDGSFAIRHTKNGLNKIDDCRKAIGLAEKQRATFDHQASIMAKTPVKPLPFFEGCLDLVLAETKATQENLNANNVDLGKILDLASADDIERWRERERKKRESIIADLVGNYNSDRNSSSAPDTVWNAFNAVTDYASHQLTYRGDNSDSNAFLSPLDGRASSYTDAALQMAISATN